MDIFQAARVGDCSQIQQNIAQLNSENEECDTALLLAAKAGHRNAVDMLIRAGASVNAIDKKGMNSTLAYLRNNDIAIFKLLLDNGAYPNSLSSSTDKSTLLVEAAYRGRDEMVTLLLAHEANADSINEFGDSALLWASQHGCLDSAKALLDAGANPSRINKNGKSIHSFAKGDRMVQLLTTYQKGGPSWLARELSAQGLSWSAVCDVEAKLVREGFVSQSVIANTPLSAFTDTALKNFHIHGVAVRAMVRDIRLRATWLGARLATHNVHADSLETCEDVILVKYNCTTPALFAALLPADLSAPVLSVYGLKPRNVGAMLRDLHSELCAELAASTTDTATTTATSDTIAVTNTTTATTSNCTSSELNKTSVKYVCDSGSSFDLLMVLLWTAVLGLCLLFHVTAPVMKGTAVELIVVVATTGLIFSVAKLIDQVFATNTTASTDASTTSIPASTLTTIAPTTSTTTATTTPTTAAPTTTTTTAPISTTTNNTTSNSSTPAVATTTTAPTLISTTTTENNTTTTTANTTAVSTAAIAAVTVAAGVAFTAVAVLGFGVCAARLLRPDASDTSTREEDTAGAVPPTTTINTTTPTATTGVTTTPAATTVVSTSNTTQSHTSTTNSTTSNTTTAHTTPSITAASTATTATPTASTTPVVTTTVPTTTTCVTPADVTTAASTSAAATTAVTTSTIAASPAEAAVARYHTGTLRSKDEWRRALEQSLMEDYLAHLRTNTSTSSTTTDSTSTTDTSSTNSGIEPICAADTTTPVATSTEATTATTNTTPSVSTASITAAATDTTTAESTPAVVAATTTDTSSATSAATTTNTTAVSITTPTVPCIVATPATTTTAAPTSATLIPPATNIDTTSIVNTFSTAASAAEAAAVALYFYGPGNELVTDLLTGTLRPKDECRQAMEQSLMEDYATCCADNIVNTGTSSTTAGTSVTLPDSYSASSVISDVDTSALITASTATTALITNVPITTADWTPGSAAAVSTARDCFGPAVRDYHTGAVLPEAQGQREVEQVVNSHRRERNRTAPADTTLHNAPLQTETVECSVECVDSDHSVGSWEHL